MAMYNQVYKLSLHTYNIRKWLQTGFSLILGKSIWIWFVGLIWIPTNLPKLPYTTAHDYQNTHRKRARPYPAQGQSTCNLPHANSKFWPRSARKRRTKMRIWGWVKTCNPFMLNKTQLVNGCSSRNKKLYMNTSKCSRWMHVYIYICVCVN